MILADIQQLDTDVLAEVRLVDKRLHSTPRGFHALKVCMVHNDVQLAAYLHVQRRDMFIQKNLVQPLDLVRGLLEHAEEDADGGSDSLIGRDVAQRFDILKRVDAAERDDRTEIDLAEQCAVDTLIFIRQYGCVARSCAGICCSHGSSLIN